MDCEDDWSRKGEDGREGGGEERREREGQGEGWREEGRGGGEG